MVSHTRRALLSGLGIAGAASVLGVATMGNSTTRSEHLAAVRVVHAVPGAPPVDVAVDGVGLLDEFAFPGVSVYYAAEAGDHQVTVAADTDEDQDGFAETATTVVDETVTLEPGSWYTAAAGGLLEGAPSPELLAFEDVAGEGAPTDGGTTNGTATATETTMGNGTTTAGGGATGTETATGGTDTAGNETDTVDDQMPLPPMGGEGPAAPEFSGARLRAVHLSPDAGAVAVEDASVAGGAPIVEELEYGSATEYLELDPGEYQIQFRQLTRGATVGPFTLSLAEGAAYSGFAMGSLFTDGALDVDGEEGFRLVPTLDYRSAAASTGTTTGGTGTETGGNGTTNGGTTSGGGDSDGT